MARRFEEGDVAIGEPYSASNRPSIVGADEAGVEMTKNEVVIAASKAELRKRRN